MFRRLPSRRTLVTGIILVDFFALLVVFLIVSRPNLPPPFILNHPYFLYDLEALEPHNDGQKCILPRLHPFHPSVWNYISHPKSIICKSRQGELTRLEQRGWLHFDSKQLEQQGYKVGDNLYCYWSPVLRAGEAGDDDLHVAYGKQLPVREEGVLLPPEVEFIRVQCQNFAGFMVYEKLHARVRNVTASPKAPVQNPVNVLIFGLDSVSRLAFIRLLPRTYKYLTENLRMTVFRGMIKVGDNTFPNLIALLTGRKAYGGGLPDTTGYFDDWPLIWNNYSEAGYGTMWAEDFPKFSLFNYLAEGFHRPPTDHYLRPFWLALEDSYGFKISSHMCYGTMLKYLLQMEYVRQFVSTYSKAKKPYFGFSFLAELGHEYMSLLATADDNLEQFFRFLQDGNHLQNTVLIVMSDHGHRFDPIRTTEVGYIEERMPFFAIHVPNTLSSLRPSIVDALSLNAGRLVTPFDTHATLTDILHFAKTGGTMDNLIPGTLGQSLFKVVPLNRTCEEASVPVHYCTCESESPLQSNDDRAKSAAEATIRRINDLLREGEVVDRCATLTLKAIRTAHLVHPAEESSDIKSRVRVVVEADPSDGVFEATTMIGDKTVEVLVEVSRLNPYAGQSDCIQHAILRKYCYCADDLRRGDKEINRAVL